MTSRRSNEFRMVVEAPPQQSVKQLQSWLTQFEQESLQHKERYSVKKTTSTMKNDSEHTEEDSILQLSGVKARIQQLEQQQQQQRSQQATTTRTTTGVKPRLLPVNKRPSMERAASTPVQRRVLVSSERNVSIGSNKSETLKGVAAVHKSMHGTLVRSSSNSNSAQPKRSSGVVSEKMKWFLAAQTNQVVMMEEPILAETRTLQSNFLKDHALTNAFARMDVSMSTESELNKVNNKKLSEAAAQEGAGQASPSLNVSRLITKELYPPLPNSPTDFQLANLKTRNSLASTASNMTTSTNTSFETRGSPATPSSLFKSPSPGAESKQTELKVTRDSLSQQRTPKSSRNRRSLSSTASPVTDETVMTMTSPSRPFQQVPASSKVAAAALSGMRALRESVSTRVTHCLLDFDIPNIPYAVLKESPSSIARCNENKRNPNVEETKREISPPPSPPQLYRETTTPAKNSQLFNSEDIDDILEQVEAGCNRYLQFSPLPATQRHQMSDDSNEDDDDSLWSTDDSTFSDGGVMLFTPDLVNHIRNRCKDTSSFLHARSVSLVAEPSYSPQRRLKSVDTTSLHVNCEPKELMAIAVAGDVHTPPRMDVFETSPPAELYHLNYRGESVHSGKALSSPSYKNHYSEEYSLQAPTSTSFVSPSSSNSKPVSMSDYLSDNGIRSTPVSRCLATTDFISKDCSTEAVETTLPPSSPAPYVNNEAWVPAILAADSFDDLSNNSSPFLNREHQRTSKSWFRRRGIPRIIKSKSRSPNIFGQASHLSSRALYNCMSPEETVATEHEVEAVLLDG